MALQIEQQEMNCELREENTMLQKKVKGNLMLMLSCHANGTDQTKKISEKTSEKQTLDFK